MRNFGNIIFNNFWAKVITFVLAIATWFYVFDLVNTDSYLQKRERVEDIFSKYDFIVKEVPIRPVFSGRTPRGYTTNFEEVKITPSKMSIFGPKDVLEDVTELTTEKIDLSEYTRSVTLKLGLVSEVKGLEVDDKIVEVFIPVASSQNAAKK